MSSRMKAGLSGSIVWSSERSSECVMEGQAGHSKQLLQLVEARYAGSSTHRSIKMSLLQQTPHRLHILI